jgi:hypothetical protein
MALSATCPACGMAATARVPLRHPPACGLDLCAREGQVRAMNVPSLVPLRRVEAETVSFDRQELGVILSVYGRAVAAGLWRDYGISCLRDRAVFSIFRRTAETPLYRIEKLPLLRRKQGQYTLFGPEGQVLKRGGDLRPVLSPLERKLLRALD